MKNRFLLLGVLAGAIILPACQNLVLPGKTGPERDRRIVERIEAGHKLDAMLFLQGREPVWTETMESSPWQISESAAKQLARQAEYRIGFQVQDRKIVADNGYHLASVNPNAVVVVRDKNESEPEKTRVIVINVPGTEFVIVIRCDCDANSNDCDWYYDYSNRAWRCSGAVCECKVDGIITHPQRGIITF